MYNISEDEIVRGIIVFAGLLIGQLFIYGGKLRARKKITKIELWADAMQYGARYVTCMSTLIIAETFGMYDGVWAKLVYCILFAMSFDNVFMRLRDQFLKRMGVIGDALFGKLPPDSVVQLPPGHADEVPVAIKAIYPEANLGGAISPEQSYTAQAVRASGVIAASKDPEIEGLMEKANQLPDLPTPETKKE